MWSKISIYMYLLRVFKAKLWNLSFFSVCRLSKKNSKSKQPLTCSRGSSRLFPGLQDGRLCCLWSKSLGGSVSTGGAGWVWWADKVAWLLLAGVQFGGMEPAVLKQVGRLENALESFRDQDHILRLFESTITKPFGVSAFRPLFFIRIFFNLN